MAIDASPIPRRSERKPIRQAVVLMIESGDAEIPQEATALDLSPHGARIAAQATLTPGQTLNLIQPDDPAHTLRCLVVWTGDVSADGQEQAGLEFLDTQPDILEN